MSLLADELSVAERLARAAGSAIMALYANVVEESKDGSPVTLADRRANEIIVEGLRTAFPRDGILSEESRDSSERLARRRVWIVDPLDGTREFVDGVDEFAVMIGLAVDGRALLGVVYCPATDLLYAGIAGEGAWIEQDGERTALHARPAPSGEIRLVGSRSHPDPRLTRIQQELGITRVRPSGSVGVKCALIANGESDLYVHPVPYLKEWDTCAPEVVLRAAGGSVCDCGGEPLGYNKSNPVQPRGIVAAAPGLLPDVIGAIRAVFDGERDGAVTAER